MLFNFKFLLLGFILLLLSPQLEAGALPATATNAVEVSLSRAVQANGIARGFAANDPLWSGTWNSVAARVTAAASDSALSGPLAVAGRSSWMGLLFLGSVAAGYELVDVATQNWRYQIENSSVIRTPQSAFLLPAYPASATYSGVSLPSTAALPFDYSNPGVGVKISYPGDAAQCVMVTGGGFGYGELNAATFCGADMTQIEDAIARYVLYEVQMALYFYSHTNPYGNASQDLPVVWSAYQKQSCTINGLVCPEGVLYAKSAHVFIKEYYNTNQTTEASFYVSFQVINNPSYVVPGEPVSLDVAANSLTPDSLNATADPQVIAQLANRAWQQASQQPGYQGVPYDPANPITATQVEAIRASDPSHFPRNYNLFEPVTTVTLDPAAQPSVTSDAGLSSGTSQTNPTVDLGPDPGVAQPTLENAPTAQSILQPLLDLLPSWKNFVMPSHTSTCTPVTFDLGSLGTKTMTSHCDLAESHRVALSAIMILVWTALAAFVVLRA